MKKNALKKQRSTLIEAKRVISIFLSILRYRGDGQKPTIKIRVKSNNA